MSDYTGPCTKTKRCPAMRMALAARPGVWSSVGLVTGFQFPTMAEVILYKPKPRDRGIILNLCPWCGAKLGKAEPKKRAALTSTPGSAKEEGR